MLKEDPLHHPERSRMEAEACSRKVKNASKGRPAIFVIIGRESDTGTNAPQGAGFRRSDVSYIILYMKVPFITV